MLLAETNARRLDDGTLQFQLPGYPRAHYSIAPWSRGFTTLHVRGRQSRPAVAWPIVVLPRSRPPCANPDVAAFVAGIPSRVARLVRRYQFGQSLLLASLAARSEVGDLAQSNANLLWLLALGAYEGRVAVGDVAKLSLRKQADLLRLLAGSGGKAQVRFLRKVRPREGTLSEARLLCRAVQEPAIVHALRHRPAIPMRLLALLTAHPLLAREELVPLMEAKLAETDDPDPERVLRLHRALKDLELFQPRGPSLVDGVETAMRELDAPPSLVRSALHGFRTPQRRDERDEPPKPFPPPPLPGAATIVPITTAGELAREGTTQRHCVGSYAHAVRRGDLYIYRVLAPQRATVEVVLKNNEIKLGQLKLSRNRKPDAATVEAVKAWFKGARRRVLRAARNRA